MMMLSLNIKILPIIHFSCTNREFYIFKYYGCFVGCGEDVAFSFQFLVEMIKRLDFVITVNQRNVQNFIISHHISQLYQHNISLVLFLFRL